MSDAQISLTISTVSLRTYIQLDRYSGSVSIAHIHHTLEITPWHIAHASFHH